MIEIVIHTPSVINFLVLNSLISPMSIQMLCMRLKQGMTAMAEFELEEQLKKLQE